jgi:hypothetical protein
MYLPKRLKQGHALAIRPVEHQICNLALAALSLVYELDGRAVRPSGAPSRFRTWLPLADTHCGSAFWGL